MIASESLGASDENCACQNPIKTGGPHGRYVPQAKPRGSCKTQFARVNTASGETTVNAFGSWQARTIVVQVR